MTETKPFVYFGTISHGTLRSEDLIPTFLTALEDLDAPRAAALRTEYGLDEDYREIDQISSEDAGWLMESLFDALDACAPAGYYFGAHPGDGSDFGFWPNDDDQDA